MTIVFVLIAAGAFIFICGLFFSVRSQRLLKNGVKTNAIVHDFTFENGKYYPIVHFTTSDDDVFLEKLSQGSNPPLYKKGDKIPILYSRNDPEDFLIDDPFALVWAPRLLIALSLIVSMVVGLDWLGYVNWF